MTTNRPSMRGWVLPAAMLAAVLVAVAVSPGAVAAHRKSVPVCKAGQRSTKAHPCRKAPPCKRGEKSTSGHPCVRVTPRPAVTTTGAPGGGSVVAPPTPGGSASGTPSCAPGEIPQNFGGDDDDDNDGGPDDGDGCL